MYDVKPNLVIGFHGCEAEVRDMLLSNPDEFKMSQKPFDWLGNGFYFWENNYYRALEWARDKQKRGVIREPAVVGAVLHLGYCCDFMETEYLRLLSNYHRNMMEKYDALGIPLPENRNLPGHESGDKVLRYLDCAAIEFMHEEIWRSAKAEVRKQNPARIRNFDSTRGVFTEGAPVFKGAGLFEKTHIQICIRNPNCILGFFKPRKEIDFKVWMDSRQASKMTTDAA
nr:hypothetical protein [uncultured Chitinophaga sp.]